MGQLGEQAATLNGVLVAHLIAHEVAITLFSSHDVLQRTLCLSDGLGNEFESRQGFLDFDPIMFSEIDKEVGGDDCLGHKRRAVEFADSCHLDKT